jgi:hypothetical protein
MDYYGSTILQLLVVGQHFALGAMATGCTPKQKLLRAAKLSMMLLRGMGVKGISPVLIYNCK